MRQSKYNILPFGLIILVILTTSCDSQTKSKTLKKNSKEVSQPRKSDYIMANEFLLKLRNEGTDTIIFCKRICINCCEFFNIFWSANGQRHFTKFYFDFDDMQNHSKTIDLKNDNVFDILNKNFADLKKSSIHGNTHKHKNGTSTAVMIDHYCYVELRIYARQDSIITKLIAD
jgi:hypothetical protein